MSQCSDRADQTCHIWYINILSPLPPPSAAETEHSYHREPPDFASCTPRVPSSGVIVSSDSSLCASVAAPVWPASPVSPVLWWRSYLSLSYTGEPVLRLAHHSSQGHSSLLLSPHSPSCYSDLSLHQLHQHVLMMLSFSVKQRTVNMWTSSRNTVNKLIAGPIWLRTWQVSAAGSDIIQQRSVPFCGRISIPTAGTSE